MESTLAEALFSEYPDWTSLKTLVEAGVDRLAIMEAENAREIVDTILTDENGEAYRAYVLTDLSYVTLSGQFARAYVMA